MTPFERQVLSELGQIRADQQNYLARMAVLEVHDHQMYGNGQPGWKRETDDRLDNLQRRDDRQRGAMWVLGGVGSVALTVLGWLQHVLHGGK